MRLFTSLCFNLRPAKPKIRLPEGFKGPNGSIFRGKYRLVKKVTHKDVEQLKEAIGIEENNMLYLRHPYLTAEESSGHAKELQKNKKWFMEKILDVRDKKFSSKKARSLVEYMEFLRINEDWDRIES